MLRTVLFQYMVDQSFQFAAQIDVDHMHICGNLQYDGGKIHDPSNTSLYQPVAYFLGL